MGQFQNKDDDEDLDLADAPASTADSSEDSEESQDAGPAAPPSVNDYIAKKYGIGNSAASYDDLANSTKQNVQQARVQAANDKSTASFGHSLAQMFAGGLGRKVDDSLYDGLRSDANQQVTNAQQDRSQQLKDYLTAKGLVKEDAQDKHNQTAWADQDTLNKQKIDEGTRTAEQQKEQDDPESAASSALREFVKGAVPALANTPGFDEASYTQLSKVYPTLISTYESAQGRIEAAKARNQTAADNAADRKLRQKTLDNEKATKEEQAAVTAAQKSLNSEASPYAKAAQAADDLSAGIAEAKVNPAANALLPVRLAKAAVGGGRINAQEIAKAGGSQAIIDRAEQIAQSMKDGTLTPENAAWMESVATLAKKGANAGLLEAEERHAGQYSAATKGKTSFEDAYTSLTGGKQYSREVSKTDPDGTVHKVTVTNLKDLKEAKAEGFK